LLLLLPPPPLLPLLFAVVNPFTKWFCKTIYNFLMEPLTDMEVEIVDEEEERSENFVQERKGNTDTDQEISM
jgi:hypothetical protein